MPRPESPPELVRSFLPLKPAVLLILLSLAEKARHGYAITVAVRDQSNGEVELGTSHLYRHLKKLLDSRLVVESQERPPNDDPRRRYYELSDTGREVLAAEMQRLEGLVRIGRCLGLAGQGEAR